MICPNCGAEVHDQAVLCVHCGNQLVSHPVQTGSTNFKTCPACGNECHKDAVVCVKCGTAFAKEKPSAKAKPQNDKGKRIAFAILSAIFFAAAYGMSIISNIRSAIYGKEFIGLLVAIPLLIAFIGLIIFAKKRNPLPSIGLAAFALYVGVVTVISLVSNGFYSSFIGRLLAVIGYLLLAVVLIAKKETKAWFLPAIIITASCVYFMILNRELYYSGWYYSSFDFGRFIRYTYNEIAEIIASVFMCLLAKYAKKTETVVSAQGEPLL